MILSNSIHFFYDEKNTIDKVAKTSRYQDFLILGTDFFVTNTPDDVFSQKKIFKNIYTHLEKDLNDIKQGKTKLIFFFIDYWGTKTIDEIDEVCHSGCVDTYNIYGWLYPQLKKLDILEHCIFVTSLSLDNIIKYDDFKIVYWNYSFNLYLQTKINLINSKNYTKKFIWLNRRARDHRIYALYTLSKANLLDENVIYTFHVYAPGNKVKNSIDYINQRLSFYVDTNLLKDFQIPPLIDAECTLDEYELYNKNALIKLYESYHLCWLELISEYNYSDHRVFLDEKIAKSIILKKPFIVIGDKNFLKELHKLGFKTFSGFWNENYDTLPTMVERVDCVVKTLQEIFFKYNWKEQIPNEMQEILDHNYNHYYGKIKETADQTFMEIFS